MIKFTGERDGKPIYGFGLSHGNLRLLKEGRPIAVDLAEMGGSGTVLIFSGATEADMARELKDAGLIHPDTPIHEQEAVQPGEFDRLPGPLTEPPA